jgi:hypothetical protein
MSLLFVMLEVFDKSDRGTSVLLLLQEEIIIWTRKKVFGCRMKTVFVCSTVQSYLKRRTRSRLATSPPPQEWIPPPGILRAIRTYCTLLLTKALSALKKIMEGHFHAKLVTTHALSRESILEL